jgi:hypothetical protein
MPLGMKVAQPFLRKFTFFEQAARSAGLNIMVRLWIHAHTVRKNATGAEIAWLANGFVTAKVPFADGACEVLLPIFVFCATGCHCHDDLSFVKSFGNLTRCVYDLGFF